MRLSYLYGIPLPAPKSAPIQILNTCRELAEAGVPSTVFAGKLLADEADALAFYGLAPHPDFALRPLFPNPLWRFRPAAAVARLLAEHDDNGPQVIMSRGLPALDAASWLRRLQRPRALFVYEAHRLCFAHQIERETGARWDERAPLSPPIQRIRERERAAIEEADGIVCLTEGVRETLTRLFQVRAPVLVLPSGTSVAVAEHDGGPGVERDLDVVYIGKLMARKGVPLLIAAMRRLPGRRLCVVGGLPEEVAACRELVGDDEVASRIEFTGFVEPRRVREYLSRARVGVCPLAPDASIISERFTSPLKLLEMMAHGVPTVASDLPVIRDIVTHGESALLVPPGDPAALADGIRILLDDRTLADRLAGCARQRVRQFSWKGRAQRLRAFLETLAA